MVSSMLLGICMGHTGASNVSLLEERDRHGDVASGMSISGHLGCAVSFIAPGI